ncbi:MAG: MarR family transcriptional regulator [Acidimicrobiales bacterium]
MGSTRIESTEQAAQLAEQLRLALGRLNRSLRLTHVVADLTSSQREILLAITRVESLRLSELASAEGLNPTMLSRIVAKLEAAQLITRSCDPGDARVIHVSATLKGLALRDTIRTKRTDALMFALGRLSDEEQRTLSVATPVLETLVAKLREREQ